MKTLRVSCGGSADIGEAVAGALAAEMAQAARAGYALRVVAVVPRMLAYFAAAPERYEVSEAAVIYWLEKYE